MRHWTDWLFAIFHPCAFAGWLGYCSGCWAWEKRAEYFRPWALRELKRKQIKEYFDPTGYYKGDILEENSRDWA